MATTATSIKLPSALKAELEKLARRSGETTHAVMGRALAEHVEAAKPREVAQIIYAAEALADLERLGEFLLEQAPESAAAVVARVTDAIEILVDHPLIGRRVEGELRELVILRGALGYLALYHFDPVRDIVRLLRIRHQREVGYRD